MSVRRRKGPAAVTWDEKEMERNTGMKRKSQRWVAAALAALTAASLVLPAYAVEQEPMSEAEMPKSSALPGRADRAGATVSFYTALLRGMHL